MAKTSLRGLVLVASILGLLSGTSLLLQWTPLGAVLSARDEFGRNLYASTCNSLLRSYFEAGGSAFVALAIPVLIAGLAADRRSAGFRWIVHGLTRVLDTVPLLFWLALIFSGIGLYGFWGRQIALILVALPFTLGIVLDRIGEVAALPFVQNARAAGVPLPERLLRLIIPNAASALYFPAVVIFGLSLTFDAVLGLMGMANRSDPSLGTLLWRAKERALVDGHLSLLAIAALLLTVAVFAGLRSVLSDKNRPALLAGDPGIAAEHG